MTNSTVNALILTQSPINTLKEPFCKDMIETPNEVKTKLSPGSSYEPTTKNLQDPTTIALSDTLLPLFNPSGITDRELLRLCQEYGGNSRAWKRKFEELLPEVLKRRLYKKHRFISIYKFSAKLCGLSHDSVDNVLRVYEKLEDMPILRSLIVEYGWSKLRIVAGIATPETDASWAEKVRVLPTSSLETIVRDFRRQEERGKIEKLMGSAPANQEQSTNQKNLPLSHSVPTNQSTPTDQKDSQRTELDNKNTTSPIFRTENLTETPCMTHFDHPNLLTSLTNHYENSWTTIPFKLSPETEFRLRKLKTRIEKGKKEKISFNQLFETMLDIIENKEKITKKSRNPYGIAPLKLRRV